jgi:hypothetical protein
MGSVNLSQISFCLSSRCIADVFKNVRGAGFCRGGVKNRTSAYTAPIFAPRWLSAHYYLCAYYVKISCMKLNINKMSDI